jgi:hypothetical protein
MGIGAIETSGTGRITWRASHIHRIGVVSVWTEPYASVIKGISKVRAGTVLTTNLVGFFIVKAVRTRLTKVSAGACFTSSCTRSAF